MLRKKGWLSRGAAQAVIQATCVGLPLRSLLLGVEMALQATSKTQGGSGLFGMKAAAKRRDVARTIDRFLDVEYHFWLNKRPPSGLIDRLVKTTLDPNPTRLAGGAMLDVHAFVGSLDALIYGSKAYNLPPEDQSMCARAAFELVLFAGKDAPPGFTQSDKYLLFETAKSAFEEPAFIAARDYSNPVMDENLEKLLAKGKAK